MSRPERYDRILNLSGQLYELLLMAYPREFRSEYGPQMAQAFRDLCREELGRSGTAPGSSSCGFVRSWTWR